MAELDLGPRSFDFKTKALSILYIGSTGLMSVIWTYILGIILKKTLIGFQNSRQLECKGSFRKISKVGQAIVRLRAEWCS